MNNKILLVLLLLALCASSISTFTAKADESANILTALSPYNVLVEAAYGGEKVYLAGLVIQRDIVPGYYKGTDSTKFYILISLSRIPDCFLHTYSFKVWQDKYDIATSKQLGAKSVSAILHLANAKANIGILLCDSLPYLQTDGFTSREGKLDTIDKEAFNNKKSFVLTPPTLIDNENKFTYTGRTANAKDFSIGSSVVLRGNTAYEVDKLSPLITGDASFAAGVPLFYYDDKAPLKYYLAGLINFERYAPDLRLDNGQLYSATAYYYPVEYIRRAIERALPPFPKLDLPAHYKGMRASGAKVTTPSEGDKDKLLANDEITAIDGVPFNSNSKISASLYIALNYSGGNKLLLIKYKRPNVKGEQQIEKAELQSSNSLWFGADAVPLPTKLKEEQYKRTDSGFFVRSIDGSLQQIAVNDLILAVQKGKDRTRFDEKFQRCCPRLDMWLWDNFGKDSELWIDYYSVSSAKALYIEKIPLKEWTNYPDTFSREPKSGLPIDQPRQGDYPQALTAAQKCIELIRNTIVECEPQDGKYAYGSELKEAIEQASELIGKLEGYISDLEGIGRDKNHAVKSIIEASVYAEACVIYLKTAKINNDTINRSISVAQSAISRLKKVVEANTPRKPPPAGSFFAKTLEEARKLITDLQTNRDTLNSPNAEKKAREDALNFIKDKTFEDLLLYYEKVITDERGNYEEQKPKTPTPPSTDFAAAITAAQNAIKDLNDAIAKVTETPPEGSDLGKALQAAKDLKAKMEGYLNTLNSTTATPEQKTQAQAGVITDITKVKDCIEKLNEVASKQAETTTTETSDYAEAIKAAETSIGKLDAAIAKVTETPPEGSDLGKALQAAKDLKAKLEGYLNTLNSTTAPAEQKTQAQAGVITDISKVKDCIEKLEEARKKQRPVLASSTELISLKNSANTAIAAAREAAQKANVAAEAQANTDLIKQAEQCNLDGSTEYKILDREISAAKSAAKDATDKAEELEDLIKELTPDSYTETNKRQVNTALEQLRNYAATANSAPGNISKARDALQSALNRKLQRDLKGRAQAAVDAVRTAANAAKALADGTKHLLVDAKDLGLAEVVYKPLDTAIENANEAAAAAEGKATELEGKLPKDNTTILPSKQKEISEAIKELTEGENSLKAKTEAAEKDLREKLDKLIEKLVDALKAKADTTVKSAKEAANKAKISASATELTALRLAAAAIDADHKGLDDAISATKNAADQLDDRANALLALLNELGPGTYESKKEEILKAITDLQTAQDELDTNAITAAAEALRSAVEEEKKQIAVDDFTLKMAQAIQAVKTQNDKTDTALADADAIIEAARAMKLDTVSVFADLSNARKNADTAKQTAEDRKTVLQECYGLNIDNYEANKPDAERLISELTSKEDGLNSITAAATDTLRKQASEMFAQLKQKANDIKNGAEKVRENASDAKEKLFVSLAKLRADKNSAQLFGLVSAESAKANDNKNLLADIETRALKFAPSGLPPATIADATAYELKAKCENTVRPALDALSAISKAIEDSQLLLRVGWPNSLTEANETNAKAIQTAFTAFVSLPLLTETAKKASRIAAGSLTMGMLITGLVLLLLIGSTAFFIPYRIASKRKAAAQAVTQADSRGFPSSSGRHPIQATKSPSTDKDQSEAEMKMRDYIVEIEKIKMQKESLIHEVAALEQKRKDLSVVISESNKAASDQTEQLRKERDKLVAELEAVKQQKSAVEDAKKSMKNLHTELERANTELLMKKAEIAELSANISKLNVENAKQNKENENLKADHEAVISAINKVALDRKIQIDDEVSEKEKHLHKLSKSIENYKKQAEDYEEVINQKKSKIEDLEVENENIIKTISDNNSNKVIIETEIEKLEEKRLDLKKGIDDAFTQIAGLETQKKKLDDKIRTLKASLEKQGIIFVIPDADDEQEQKKPEPKQQEPKKPEPKSDKSESTRKKAPSERSPLPHDPKPMPKKPGYTETAPVSNERTLDHIIRHDLTDFEARILNSIIRLYSGNRTVSTGRLWVRLKHHDIMSYANIDDEKAALASIGKLQVKFTNSVEEGISGVSLISNESEKEKERWVRFLRSFAERISRDKGLIKALDDRISTPPEPHGDETIVIDPNRKQTEPPVKIDLIGIDDDTGIQISIGRDKSCGFVIESEAASKDHATLSLVKGKMVLTDNKSTNGTYVNGVRISRAEVGYEDRVTFGDQTTTIGKIIESQDED